MRHLYVQHSLCINISTAEHKKLKEMLTYELSDHILVQSKDQSSDHSECISVVGLFLLKAAEH